MKRIMITNDDGISAKGIIRLARAAKKYGEVWVVAPDVQKSGASQSIQLHDPIIVKDAEFPVDGIRAFSVASSPADCTKMGCLYLLPEKPDIVLSGINFGYNAGYDVRYSGTIGAAMEALYQGIPAIAVSEGYNGGSVIADMYLEKILDDLMEREPILEAIWNVNFPDCRPDELKGILYDRTVTKASLFRDNYPCTVIAEGVRSFMSDGIRQDTAEEGSDLRALFDGYISVGKYYW